MDEVSTRSLYLEPAAVPWFPERCRVVDVSPLLRELLLAAVELPPEYDGHGRDGCLIRLILFEIRSLTPLPFDLPPPARADLRSLCERVPIRTDNGLGCARMGRCGVGRRTQVQQAFLEQTGLSFRRWRQRACVLFALRELSAGESVTRVAAALEYDTAAAFKTMFRKQTGRVPSSFQPR
ncbi:hypothetical protein BJY24_001803 [Nocardia transvalensis]|uniref:HTH araC/xylS-type domain-containing protein n=1 Tax=Nocardia transvalensis TaxID=37333 RepID=A0A7W9PBF4_9NOCA|nr:helix-turn-helix transcriptional regulator [Nocardia transvalensis]MBB5912936.1 hypothetical protein [Nocardia transvalensis]